MSKKIPLLPVPYEQVKQIVLNLLKKAVLPNSGVCVMVSVIMLFKMK